MIMKYLVSIRSFLNCLQKQMAYLLVSFLFKGSKNGIQLCVYIAPALGLAFLCGASCVFFGIAYGIINLLTFIGGYINEYTKNSEIFR